MIESDRQFGVGFVGCGLIRMPAACLSFSDENGSSFLYIEIEYKMLGSVLMFFPGLQHCNVSFLPAPPTNAVAPDPPN